MLLDSNIIIYAGLAPAGPLRDLLVTAALSASAVSRIEVLGFHRLTAPDAETYRKIFQQLKVYPVDDAVIDRAVALRQQRKMSLGDSIVAATALVHGLTLVTRNVDDFRRIDGLSIHNPFSPT